MDSNNMRFNCKKATDGLWSLIYLNDKELLTDSILKKNDIEIAVFRLLKKVKLLQDKIEDYEQKELCNEIEF